MIRTPGHLANAVAATSAPPRIEGLDLALAAGNVRRAGGDPSRFAGSLAAALRAEPAPQRERALSLSAVAAWRAGALAYRDDALDRLDALLDDGGAPAAAAVLSMAPSDAESFATTQRTDRFWWPGRAAERGYVCAVGGFAGFGGLWTAPPAEGVALTEPGAFAIRAGDEWWRLDADVWGSRLVRLDDAPEPQASAGSSCIVCLDDSYLAWVHVKDAA